MVRRGSTVRVRQRALAARKFPQIGDFCCLRQNHRAPPGYCPDRYRFAAPLQSACKSACFPIRRSTSLRRTDSTWWASPGAPKVAGTTGTFGIALLGPTNLGDRFWGQRRGSYGRVGRWLRTWCAPCASGASRRTQASSPAARHHGGRPSSARSIVSRPSPCWNRKNSSRSTVGRRAVEIEAALIAEEVRSSWAIRSRSARKSISTIFPFFTVKAPTENGLPSRNETVPGAPLTRARRVVRPVCDQ